jgi:hypothetical protein
MAIEGEAKTAVKAFKTHWVAVAILSVVVLLIGIRYDRKNNGALSAKLAKLPLVGNWFAT